MNRSAPPQFSVVSAPSGELTAEQALYSAYLAAYLKDDGGVISNVGSVSWCPNSCIGCGSDVTSEGIARLARVAALEGDKQTFDKVNTYAKTVMRHPETGFLMWKLKSDGSVGGCGGENSAVDGELILIGARLKADATWPNNGYGADARALMESLKSGLINGSYLPNCMYAQGGKAAACGKTVFLGYLNLPVLKQMCNIDPFWCSIHTLNKQLLIRAVQGEGIYSTYYADQNRWAWENAPIHPQWAMKMLVADGDTDAWAAIQPLYTQARTMFLNNTANGRSEICQEFNPSSGCKAVNANLDIYSGYLEMATARNDVVFASALKNYIIEKLHTISTKPLAGVDNFQNICTLECLLSS